MKSTKRSSGMQLAVAEQHALLADEHAGPLAPRLGPPGRLAVALVPHQLECGLVADRGVLVGRLQRRRREFLVRLRHIGRLGLHRERREVASGLGILAPQVQHRVRHVVVVAAEVTHRAVAEIPPAVPARPREVRGVERALRRRARSTGRSGYARASASLRGTDRRSGCRCRTRAACRTSRPTAASCRPHARSAHTCTSLTLPITPVSRISLILRRIGDAWPWLPICVDRFGNSSRRLADRGAFPRCCRQAASRSTRACRASAPGTSRTRACARRSPPPRRRKASGSSNTLRRSVNFLACGYRTPAESSDSWLMSQSATMFSSGCLSSGPLPSVRFGGSAGLIVSSLRLARPRPPAPMTAMLSLLLRFCPRRSAGALRQHHAGGEGTTDKLPARHVPHASPDRRLLHV